MIVMANKKAKPWKALSEARKRQGHTQAEAAERVGISQGNWSAIEAGERRPSRPLHILLTLYIAGKLPSPD